MNNNNNKRSNNNRPRRKIGKNKTWRQNNNTQRKVFVPLGNKKKLTTLQKQQVRFTNKRSAVQKGGPGLTKAEKRREYINNRLEEKYKFDIRGPRSHVMELESTVVNPAISITVPTEPNRFAAVIMGVISYALDRGWSLDTTDDSFPYLAWVYQSKMLMQAAQGAVPFSGNVPRWMNILCQALIKKEVSYRGGQITYNFNFDQNTFDNNYLQTMGPYSGYKYNLGIKTTSTINGKIPVMGMPAGYTDQLGQQATQNLWLFLQSREASDPKHKMEPINKKNSLTKDISAYAFFDTFPGGGQNDTGGWFKETYCEVSTTRPLFSCFAKIPSDGLLEMRSRVKLRLFSGDAVMLGGMAVGALKEKQLALKTPPVVKFVDFLELADVYLRVLNKAITISTQQSFFSQEAMNNSNVFVDKLQCPLTFLEFLLLFRATCMLILTDNYALQGLFPRGVVNNSNEFVVYNVGVNTYPIYFGNLMLIPKLLQENLLALRSRWVASGALGTANPVMVRSCLGQYAYDQLNSKDYNVEYVIENTTYTGSIFITPPTGYVDICLIDGSYVSGTTTKYAAINDPVYLAPLANKFNLWIQGLGNTIRNLNSCATDGGINALSMIHFTTHWLTDTGPAQILDWKKTDKKLIEKESRDLKAVRKERKAFEKRMGMNPTSVYGSKQLIALSVGHQVIDSVWTGFQQYFVTPTNSINPATNYEDATYYVSMAGYMREPRQISGASGSNAFMTLESRHENFADLMVKTPFAMETSQDKALADADKKGEGGILGGVIQALSGAVGHAAVDVGAQMLGEVIPF
jgi:hypothetical protein